MTSNHAVVFGRASRASLAALALPVLFLALQGCNDDGVRVCDELGTEGCPCPVDGPCEDALDGTALSCTEGLCQRPECPVGREGCACAFGDRCATGLVCEADGMRSTCVPACEPGTRGCPCIAGEVCRADADGTPLLCGLGSCVRADCEVGTFGCVCGNGSHCGEGLVCTGGFCDEDSGQTLTPPTDPRCYTPCEGGSLSRLVDGDEVIVACSEEGLIEGCIGGARCIQGSCVSASDVMEAESVGACTADRDCPDYQSCIEGRCYSDCEADVDCRSPRVCHRKTCRLPCDASADASSACPEDSYCESEDGATGHCLPLAEGSSMVLPSVDASYQVTEEAIELTSSQVTASFEIVNNGPAFRQFTVRKARHREYPDDGPVEVEESPLFWLELGRGDETPMAAEEITVGVDGEGGRATVRIANADNPTLDRWDGVLEVENRDLGLKEVRLAYRRLPEGQWTGQMFYLANFGTAGLDEWRANKESDAAVRAVGNALIRRWHAFRKGRISFREFKAVLTATREETWKTAGTTSRCPTEGAPNPNVGCYLYDNNEGIAIYSDFLPDNPIPSGVTELPMGFNIRMADNPAEPGADPRHWAGKVVSDRAMHYAGDPAVDLRFQGDPSSCQVERGGACLTFLDALRVDVIVGGRYPTYAADSSCSLGGDGFVQNEIPWLVPGFDEGTVRDPSSGLRYRYECRDRLNPLGSSVQVAAENASLAGSNPIPNGRSITRSLRVVDGALINQRDLFVLFEERFPSPLDPEDDEVLTAYGFMILGRSPTDLGPRAYDGSVPDDDRTPPALEPETCSPEVLDRVFADVPGAQLDGSTADPVAQVVVQGVPQVAVQTLPIDPSHPEKVHYYCEDTGYFDGGPRDDNSGDAVKIACPPGSKVEFFTVQDDPDTVEVEGTQAWIAGLSCQTTPGTCREGQPCTEPVDCSSPYVGTPGDNRTSSSCVEAEEGCEVGTSCTYKGSCGSVLNAWKAQAENLDALDGSYGPRPSTGARNDAEKLRFRHEPPFTCKDPDRIECISVRTDLRVERDFYPYMPAATPTYRSIDAEIDQAFRYKTKFQSREGSALGFTPDVCVSGTDLVPYCYDPEAIQEIEARVDCATHIYTRYYDDLSGPTKALLKNYLSRNFANDTVFVPGEAVPRTIDGFEHLNAELLVMLGDEALADASSSRFDLAGQQVAPFPGDELEPGGIQLSGGAGFEMYNLYLATQYYQLALDRFFGRGEVIWASLGGGPDALPPGEGFIGQATATSWFDRLIKASSHKARASAEIVRRYQSFNRADLARLVARRSYTAAYMEAAILSRLMYRLIETASAAEVDQIVQQLEQAQHTYRRSLQNIREVYESITDDVTLFGFAPDYVPFPGLSRVEDTNAFLTVLERAKQRLAVAADKEMRALDDRREFETDAAEFQSELSELKIEYDRQLQDICGSFEVDDPASPGSTRIVPSIPENASLDPRLVPFGDPCGRTTNGTLYEAMGELEQELLRLEELELGRRHLMDKVLGAEARAAAHCQSAIDYANWSVEQEDKKLALGTAINTVNLIIDTIERFGGTASKTTATLKCAPLNGECAVSGTLATTQASLSSALNGVITGLKASTVGLEVGLALVERGQVKEGILQDCDAVKIDAQFVVKDLFRQALELQQQAVRQAVAIKVAASRVERLRNEASSLIAAKNETLGHLINVEAARNDPNIRIYTQDAVFAAERTYRRALREVYKATRVFEYYTNQSYARRDDLFLVRMVQFGDPSLEAYVEDLEDSFLSFEEQFGRPDLRVAVVSMRDDVLAIPHLDDDGTGLTHEARVARFRDKLREPGLLDDRGYISAPFATRLEQVSPLTFNHKLRFVEAEIVSEDNAGDRLGRVYLTQQGTGAVRRSDGETAFYAFPERTAVINTYFNGERPLERNLRTGEDIYQNERLRDRPLVNTGWNIVFNQKDEEVNEDIDVASIDDIRLYLFYTDFTGL
jgi:hypothetical protein